MVHLHMCFFSLKLICSSLSFFCVNLHTSFFSLKLVCSTIFFSLDFDTLRFSFGRHTSLLSACIDSCFFCWPTFFNNKGLTCTLPPGHWKTSCHIYSNWKTSCHIIINKNILWF